MKNDIKNFSILKVLLFLTSFTLLNNSCSCPDLSFCGLKIKYEKLNGATSFGKDLTLNAVQILPDGSKGNTVVIPGDSIFSCPLREKGRYQFSGTIHGQTLGPIDNVCFIGNRVGCSADETPQSDATLLIVRETKTGEFTMFIDHNGKCP